MLSLDKFDHEIIQLISNNARMTLSDIATNIGLSKTPCQNRIKRLEKAGFITGYHAKVNFEKLGLAHVAFIQVTLTDTHTQALDEFNRHVKKIPQVEQCHMIASSFDYLLKVRTQNMSEYKKLLGEVISNLPHVSQTSTFVAMDSIIE